MKLAHLYSTHEGKVSDKWSTYLPLYEDTITSLCAPVNSLLEIGVQNGGSLEIWAQYLADAKVLVGCDIDERCRALVFDDARIKLVVGDATNETTRQEVLKHSTQFDVVVEDGSHVPADVIKAFVNYWPAVRPGGVFIAEDLHCDYFPGHEGSVYRTDTANNFFAKLIHLVNYEHWAGVRPIDDLFTDFAMVNAGVAQSWVGTVRSVSFHNSVAIVHKAQTATDTELGRRTIVGRHALVDAKPMETGAVGSDSLVALHEAPRRGSSVLRTQETTQSKPSTFSQLYRR